MFVTIHNLKLMPHFQYIKLQNYVRYKEAFLDLNYKGITVIRGKNKKAGPEASNGSGKSLMVGALPNLLFDATPLSSARNSGKKDTFKSGTLIETKLDNIVIQKKQSKSKLSYVFKTQGQDAKVRTVALAKQKLLKLFPLTEEEFYSFVYIDARRPLLFSLGTAAKRFDFFTSLFRLHSYDDIRAFFNAKIREINKDKTLLLALKKEVKQLKEEKVGDLPTIKKRIQTYREERESLSLLQRKLFDKINIAKELEKAKMIKSKIDKARIKYGKDFVKVIVKLKAEIKNRSDLMRELERLQDSFQEEDLKFYNKARAHDVNKLTRLLQNVRGEQTLLRGFQLSLNKHETKEDKCPVCKSDVKGHAQLVKDLETRLESLIKRATKIKNYLNAHTAFTIKSSIDNINNQLKEQKTEFGKFSIDELEKRLEEIQEIVHLAKTIKDVDFSVKLNINVVESKLENAETRLTKLNAVLEKLTAQYEVGIKVAAQLKEKRAKITQLEFEAKDLEIYEMLVGAYKTEGLKLLMISRIAKIVETNLNLYASLLFHEPYKFIIEVGKNSFNLICYILDGKKKVEQRDIKHLSGAESRAFNLLFSLSLLPLIPKDRRCNIIVLDEPDTNFDKQMTRSFAEDFLPKLNSLIPHIIVVTPLDTPIAGAREFIAVKEGKTTKLQNHNTAHKL